MSSINVGAFDPLYEPRRVRLRTLTLTRWVGVTGQALALLVVHYGLGFRLPMVESLTIVGLSAILNLIVTVVMVERPAAGRLTDRGAALFLAFDIVQLGVLLYLTGGLENPFALLLLAPVTVSATILTLRSTIFLCCLSILAITVLAVWHLPLPWRGGGLALPLVYVMGLWTALGFGIVFLAFYTWRVAREARHISDALAATQLALAREQQLSAVGALAAAAAHELGSPLGTIAVVAREIARDLPDDSPMAEDVELLLSQSARCRDILADLVASPAGEGGEPFSRMPVSALVEMAAAPHERPGIALHFDAAPESEDDVVEPTVARSPEILHGLGNFVQNAAQFARTAVTVETRWTGDTLSVTVRDDGPGFSPGVLERLGEPYVSSRLRRDGHMGLGVFIAKTLLERTGADVSFANARQGGGEVAVRWNRAILEPLGSPAAAGAH